MPKTTSVRKGRMGRIVRLQSNNGGFVDLPTSASTNLEDGNISIVVQDKLCEEENCIVMNGCLLMQDNMWSLYSCGGLFLKIKGVSDEKCTFRVSKSEL